MHFATVALILRFNRLPIPLLPLNSLNFKPLSYFVLNSLNIWLLLRVTASPFLSVFSYCSSYTWDTCLPPDEI